MSILYIFDCDGVILDSNAIKSEAFEYAVSKSELPGADWLVQYNRDNGGMSRQIKFKHYVEKFNLDYSILDDLLEAFSYYTSTRLCTCSVSSFFGSDESLRIASSSCVVSGGSEEEITETFKKRNLLRFFERGIYGNPVSKRSHLQYLIDGNMVSEHSVYYGDSLLDYKICQALGIKFVFIAGWSEFNGWEKFFSDKDVPTYCTLNQAFGMHDDI